jgi:hypothetical protein
VDRQDGCDGFILLEKLVCDILLEKLVYDDAIRFVAVTNWCALINVGNYDLPREGNARLFQFAAQALLVNGFQQAGAGAAMHRDRQSDHPIIRSVNGCARSIKKHKTFSVITVLSALSPC